MITEELIWEDSCVKLFKGFCEGNHCDWVIRNARSGRMILSMGHGYTIVEVMCEAMNVSDEISKFQKQISIHVN